MRKVIKSIIKNIANTIISIVHITPIIRPIIKAIIINTITIGNHIGVNKINININNKIQSLSLEFIFFLLIFF